MKKNWQDGYQQALVVLRHCARPSGWFASGLPGGYAGLWARDSMITSLGASLAGADYKKTFQASLSLLSKYQSKLGQIPNAVGDYNTDRRSRVTFNTIDSTLWYIVGHYIYARAYGDQELLKKYKRNINRAFLWLAYQDPNEDKLLVQQPTMDWQDAFPHKYGRVINTQALYYAALRMAGQNQLAEHLKNVVNGQIETYLSLYDKKLGYYLPWIWKNHDGDREQEEWFDTLGNLLAIISGLATPGRAVKILDYIEAKKINRPYPCQAIYPSFRSGTKEWHSYFSKAMSKPYQYLNAGIWPFIGAFYVAALVKTKRYVQAERELELLTKANKLGRERAWEFNEWLDGRYGRPRGTAYQGWSAGAYLWAWHCARDRKVPYFNY